MTAGTEVLKVNGAGFVSSLQSPEIPQMAVALSIVSGFPVKGQPWRVASACWEVRIAFSVGMLCSRVVERKVCVRAAPASQ